MADVNWNVFRYVGDYLHLGGMLMGLAVVVISGSVQGFSRKTQALYQAVYFTRYLDIFTQTQVRYLLIFKVSFNAITALMLLAFARLHTTYEAADDSCNLVAILAPVAVASHLASRSLGFVDKMWTFSEFLEPVALLPQYIMCYRAKRIRPAAVMYTVVVGGYRTFYVCNWIYKRYELHGAYHDYTSWLGGAVECVLFFDFLLRIVQRKEEVLAASVVGRTLLTLDDGAGLISEKIEMGSIGRRLPYGLSGGNVKDPEMEKIEWDAKDKLVDEESCGLLTLSGDADI